MGRIGLMGLIVGLRRYSSWLMGNIWTVHMMLTWEENLRGWCLGAHSESVIRRY
jgi:hypothetical protein